MTRPSGDAVREVPREMRCRNTWIWEVHLHQCQLDGPHVRHRCYCARNWDDAAGQPYSEFIVKARPESQPPRGTK